MKTKQEPFYLKYYGVTILSLALFAVLIWGGYGWYDGWGGDWGKQTNPLDTTDQCKTFTHNPIYDNAPNEVVIGGEVYVKLTPEQLNDLPCG